MSISHQTFDHAGDLVAFLIDRLGEEHPLGFQAGAVRMAYLSNISLTSLAELRDNASDELLMLRLGQSRQRTFRLTERLSIVGQVEQGGGFVRTRIRRTSGTDPIRLHAALVSRSRDACKQTRVAGPLRSDGILRRIE
jgi:hypothetical protein